jgi:hypothetical protein
VSENSKIEWTGHKLGAIKVAAKRIGVSFDTYMANVSSGKRWCHACRAFHDQSIFGSDISRSDGIARICLEAKSQQGRSKYVHIPRRRGRSFGDKRDGDKNQARGRVNHLVSVGLLADANAVPCVDCGHEGSDRRHEYDHHLGYAARHHEDVQSVCTKCHRKRTIARGELVQARDEKGRFKEATHG